jgi:Xaa-Pro aminopeptidase
MYNLRRGESGWIDDWRGGITGSSVVNVLREKGFDSANIGVVGLKGEGIIGDPEGIIPYTSWAHVLEQLPNATFTDVSRSLIEVVLPKSEEELTLIRQAAQTGEKACQAMVDVIKPGVSESEIFAAVTGVIFANGANFRGINMLSGVDNPSWGRPKWLNRPQRPPIIQKGEIVLGEWGPSYGGLEAQQQMTVALKPVHPVNQELAEVAKRSLEVGLKTLRPGKTFKEVCDAMEEPIQEAGCWHLTPLIHTVNPILMVSQRQVGMIDSLPGIQDYNASQWEKGEYEGYKARPITGGDMIIKPGMCFAMEPNACRENHRVNIGGTAIVTEDGVEEVNTLPNEMYVKD